MKWTPVTMTDDLLKEHDFNDRTWEALEPAIGDRLIHVVYWCMEKELAERDIKSFQLFFGGEVELVFEKIGSVFLCWDSDSRYYKPDGTWYFLRTAPHSFFKSNTLGKIEVDHVQLWKGLVGTNLKGIEVLGQDRFPFVVRLTFGREDVYIGSGREDLKFGDGDEVVVRKDLGYFATADSLDLTTIWKSG